MKRRLLIVLAALAMALGVIIPAASTVMANPVRADCVAGCAPIVRTGTLCLNTQYCMGNKNFVEAQGNPTIMWQHSTGGRAIDWALAKVGSVSVNNCFPWPCHDNLNTKYAGNGVYLFAYDPAGAITNWCTINNGINTNSYLYQCDATKTNQLWVDGYSGKYVAVYDSYLGEFNNTIYYLATTCKSCDGTPVTTAPDGTAYVNWGWYSF